MHGIIFKELESFVEAGFGKEAWPGLLQESGIGPKIYLPVQAYPDEEIVSLVATASKVTGIGADELLEKFGAHLVPTYLKLYGHLLDKSWRTLDVIENTEETIHKVVRLKNPGAAPPALVARRVSDTRVDITYTSKRRMCAVARGICNGVAAQFGEKITIDEPRCMHRGDNSCEIVVQLSR